MEKFENPAERVEKISAFQEKYLPEGMRTQKKVNLVIAAGMELLYARRANIEGVENLPESGPFIVVANHFNVKETEILLATLKNYDAHLVAAKKIHGEHPITKLKLKAVRGITVPESLAHLSPEEKEELLERIPSGRIKEKYQAVVDQEAAGETDRTGLIEFVRSSVALFPEAMCWLFTPRVCGYLMENMENPAVRISIKDSMDLVLSLSSIKN